MYTYPAAPIPAYLYPTNTAFKTLVSDFDSGAETRRKLIRFPKRGYSLTYNNITLANRNILHAFYLNVGGMADSFWFVDWASRTWIDEYVGRGGPLNLIGAIYDDGGVQTNQTIACVAGTANAMTLLPVLPVVNDAYYFGSLNQFDRLILNIGTAGAPAYVNGVSGWEFIWEFWDGNSWEILVGLVDQTIGFTVLGVDYIYFTIPTDWTITSISGVNAYWIRARVNDFETITIRPLGSGCTANSKTYDLHGVTCSGVSVYVDGILKAAGGADYTFVSGGGAAGADRITFVAYPTIGQLITSTFTGYLRLKARLGDDAFNEEIPYIDIYNTGLKLVEVQW